VWERNGSLEIAVATAPIGTESTQDQTASIEANTHLVWRVRLLNLTETEIQIEEPSALGQAIQIDAGVTLIVVLSIGQNRWMFSTKNLGHGPTLRNGAHNAESRGTLRLAMPEHVQRCQRRQHYRVETAALYLPEVDIWPLLDPRSVMIAERACELKANKMEDDATKTTNEAAAMDLTLPEVGPKFTGTLVNLGGGGVGLRVSSNDSQPLNRHKRFWMRIALPAALSTPICATGKLVHTHMESNQDTYAGLAFDFSFNPAHQQFVVDQICRYISLQQRAQLGASADALRKIA
jgi:hypothetical protein